MGREHRQRGSHVLILHQNPLGSIQMGGCEIPDGLDAVANQQVADILGMGCGDGNDAHEDIVLAADLLQAAQGEDGLTALHAAAAALVGIKGSYDIQTVFGEAAVAQEGSAQFACAYQNRIVGVVAAQKLLDILNQTQAAIAHLGTATVGSTLQSLL